MTTKRFTVLDGGTATELVRLGHSSVNAHPLYSASLLTDNAESIVQAHKNFLLSGSDIVVTVSYQTNIESFITHLNVSQQQAYNLLKKTVEVARSACDEVEKQTGHRGQVAGSVGPYGACLYDMSEYTGDYIDKLTEQELRDWHRPRIHALSEAGADLVAIETQPCQREACVIVELLEKEFPELKAYVTFSCKNGSETCGGDRFCDAINSVIQSQSVIAAGINCTDPQYITPLLKSIQHLQLVKPIIVKPNSGENWGKHKGWYGKESTVPISEMVPEWVENGASWIGGCCRIYPDDIAKVKHKLQQLESNT